MCSHSVHCVWLPGLFLSFSATVWLARYTGQLLYTGIQPDGEKISLAVFLLWGDYTDRLGFLLLFKHCNNQLHNWEDMYLNASLSVTTQWKHGGSWCNDAICTTGHTGGYYLTGRTQIIFPKNENSIIAYMLSFQFCFNWFKWLRLLLFLLTCHSRMFGTLNVISQKDKTFAFSPPTNPTYGRLQPQLLMALIHCHQS